MASYGRATIGTRHDLENASIPLLRAFYKRYYQPDNAVLVVGGTFDPAWVLATIARHFGPIPRPERTLMAAVTAEPAQEGERLVTLLRADDTRIIGAMYHVPQAAHPDAVPMWLLLQVLSGPSGGRLNKSLVDARKASSVSAEIGAMRDPGTVLFLVEVSKGKSLELANEALLEQVEGLAERPVTTVELERVRVDARNAIDRVFRNPDALVMQLSEAIAWGDWRLWFLLRDRVENASVEDLQRVAMRYLRRANRTEGRLIPGEQPQRVEMPPPTDLAHLLDGYRGKPVAAPPPQFDPAPENIEAHTQRFTFSNGMKLAMLSRPTRGDIVTGMLILNMGTIDSLKGRAPVAELTAAALTHGAGGRDREQLADLLARLKSTVNITAQADRVTIRFETHRDQLADFLPVLHDILRKPALDTTDFDDIKRSSIAEIERVGNAPGMLASVTMDRHDNPYPPGDPRHTQDQRERIAGVDATRVDDIRDFHHRFYGASHSQLALVGDFDVDGAKDQLEKLFGDWSASEPYVHVDRPYRPITPATLTAKTTNNASAIYLARIPMAVTMSSADYADLAIADRIYGGKSLRGRLSERLRQSDGISYSAGSSLQINAIDTAGSFTMQASFAPRNLERVKRAAEEELARFVRDGITAEELADAKSGLLEQGTIARTRDSVLAQNLADQLSVGQTMDFTAEQEQHVRTATVASVNAAIRKYIVPKRVISVFAGDLRSGAAKAAPASR
ncbi:M16 family metallopeptidase [Cupriavidus sp. 2TAF22]|uniref:M16 family metallopeptidase n=1 Tax=unclassified Cupriavidus TaxID=2640874 RepID=UPI003F91BB71